MTQADHNPYAPPHERASELPAVRTTRQKYLRRYARCFWVSLAIVAGGFSIAASATFFDPRLHPGQALLALAFFPYYIPVMGALISATVFGGFWLATWFSADSAYENAPGAAQAGALAFRIAADSQPVEGPSKRLSWRQWILMCLILGALLIFVIGVLQLKRYASAYLRGLPTLTLAGIVLVVALAVLMARMFRSKSRINEP